MGEELVQSQAALRDFRLARRQANLEMIMARLTGRSADLLSYEDVRRQLKARTAVSRGLQEIPLDAIVGSVGRYADFTRTFLPLQDSDQTRWTRVEQRVKAAGYDPIDVYQIGDAYFVLDGNHRVSIARQSGAKYIQAYVTEVQTRVPLSPDDDPDDIILKARYAEFLERTRLDELRPEADLTTTVPGQYRILEEHIQVHRYFMGLEQQREIPDEEAVTHWYDTVYLPVIEVIRAQDILRDFPGRTETDLYLWVSEHRMALAEALGWEVDMLDAARDLAEQASPTPQRVFSRLTGWVWDVLTPAGLETGPRAGQWRELQLAARSAESMSSEILVPISGEPASWLALEQAILVAQREQAQLRGLHVVASKAEANGAIARQVKSEFERRCQAANLRGQLATEVGPIARTICERARWADLTVVHLAHPPEPRPLARVSSGFRTLLFQCPTPVLAVPGTTTDLKRPLLAFDGGAYATEALYLAVYLVNRWQVALTILIVREEDEDVSMIEEQARRYLDENQATAEIHLENGSVAEAVLRVASQRACDVMIVGGYSRGAVLHAMWGSALDELLVRTKIPVLVCR